MSVQTRPKLEIKMNSLCLIRDWVLEKCVRPGTAELSYKEQLFYKEQLVFVFEIFGEVLLSLPGYILCIYISTWIYIVLHVYVLIKVLILDPLHYHK